MGNTATLKKNGHGNGQCLFRFVGNIRYQIMKNGDGIMLKWINWILKKDWKLIDLKRLDKGLGCVPFSVGKWFIEVWKNTKTGEIREKYS